MTIGDKGAAYLRTVIPFIWGAVITQLLIWWPAAPDAVNDLSDNQGIIAAITAVVILGWYAIWRKVEPRLPAWLTRLVLGSNQTPTYEPTPVLTTSQGATTVSDEGDGVTNPAELVAESDIH